MSQIMLFKTQLADLRRNLCYDYRRSYRENSIMRKRPPIRAKDRTVPAWASESSIPSFYRFIIVNDITGQKFGRLEAIDKFQIINNRMHWVCVCDCGELRVVSGGNLRDGNTKSCGCYRREASSARLKERREKHNWQARRKAASPSAFADPLRYLFGSVGV